MLLLLVNPRHHPLARCTGHKETQFQNWLYPPTFVFKGSLRNSTFPSPPNLPSMSAPVPLRLLGSTPCPYTSDLGPPGAPYCLPSCASAQLVPPDSSPLPWNIHHSDLSFDFPQVACHLSAPWILVTTVSSERVFLSLRQCSWLLWSDVSCHFARVHIITITKPFECLQIFTFHPSPNKIHAYTQTHTHITTKTHNFFFFI